MNKQNSFQRGDVYLAEFDHAVGSEILGPHPIVLLQNNVGNYHGPTVIGAAITSQIKKPFMPTHILLKIGPCAGSMVMTEQIHTIDKTRLMKYVCTLDANEMKEIDKAVIQSLGLTAREPTLLCLCPRCLRDFRAIPGHSAKRANPFQVITESCTYCGNRQGYDYWVTEQEQS